MNIRRNRAELPEDVTDDALEQTTELAEHAIWLGSVASSNMVIPMLEDEYGKDCITRNGGEVVRDNRTGLFVKIYDNRADAELQFGTMNAIGEKLRHAQVGVTAVQHFSLLTSDNDRGVSVAVLEPASGVPASDLYKERCDRILFAKDIRKRLDEGLGKRASRVLVNDLTNPGNYLGNVFVSSKRGYKLIDQPFYDDTLSPRKATSVLKALDVANARDIANHMKENGPIDRTGFIW